MEDPRLDLRAVLAEIDRNRAETVKLLEEQSKLASESAKLLAEQRKLVTEERKMERDRFLGPLLAVGGLAVGAISAAATIMALFLRLR